MSEGARVVVPSTIWVYPDSSSQIRLLDDHVLCHLGVILIYDIHAWVIIMVGVILVYKELTTSVVPKYTDNNKTWSDLLIFTQYMLHLCFDLDRDAIGNHTCRNLVIHMDMLSLHLSTAQIDDFVLPMLYVSERDFTHVWRVGLGSLRKPDLMLQALLSHHLVFLILFLEEKHIE